MNTQETGPSKPKNNKTKTKTYNATHINPIEKISDAAHLIGAAYDENELMNSFKSSISQIIHSADFQIYQMNNITGDYNVVIKDSSIQISSDIIREILDNADEKIFTKKLDDDLLTIIPLSVRGITVGCVGFKAEDVREFINSSVLASLDIICSQASIALINMQLYHNLENKVNDLAQAKSLLFNTIECINSGILTLDMENNILQINKNAMTMLDVYEDNIIGQPYNEVFKYNENLVTIFNEIIEETKNIGFSQDKVFTQTLALGAELTFNISASLLRDEMMDFLGVIMIFRDMTASVELDRLRKLDQLKSQFVANVSHELKTPLTSISAYTEALTDMEDDNDDEDSAQRKEFLKIITDESDRLLALIEDLLDVARLESGKVILKFQTIQPEQIIKEIMGVSKIQSTKHTIITNIDEDLPIMSVDKDKIKEVLINLISNAIKYSPEGGDIVVNVLKDGKNLKIEVKDQGLGISEENLDHIFGQFYRVDSSMTANISGTGLGLAIVKNIIEAHSGTIKVKSKIGEGSSFIVYLPIRKMK